MLFITTILRAWRRAASLALLLIWQFGPVAGDAVAQRRQPFRQRSSTVPAPEWDASVRAVFFDDAASQLGSGRPGSGAVAGEHPTGGGANSREHRFAWSKLISATAIEAEIENLTGPVAAATATPGEFKSGAFRDARRDFSVLAVMFALIDRYDGPVRFQAAAAAMRDAVGRAAKNCKVESDGAFNEARQRANDLVALTRGSPLDLPGAQREVAWPDVADRSPLMQRMEIGHRDRLKAWTGNRAEYSGHRETIAHEAQLLCAFSEVLKDENYDYADDETYQQYIAALQESALAVTRAADADDFAAVQSAVSALGKACDDCHGDFR